MNIYVAGRSTDVATVQGIAESLEAEGHRITFKWYDPEQGEIRSGSLESKDIEVVTSSPEQPVVEKNQGDWTVTVRHKPTGEEATGTGYSFLAATDVAVNILRGKINAGWAENPERAREIAQKEMMAVAEADVVVLVWAPDLLGAAIETGAALFNSDIQVYIYRPGRDLVFWYLPNAHVVWTKANLLDALKEHEWML